MTAAMFVPIPMNDAVLTASNIPETDYPAWVTGTSYTTGDRVIRTVTHSVYEAVTTGVSNTAPENDAVQWIRVGATNRWRPFDGSIGQNASQTGVLNYTLTSPTINDAIAFVGLIGVSVRVTVRDASSVIKYNEKRELLDTRNIASWLDFFTYESEFDDEQVFVDLPVFPTYTVQIIIDGDGGTAAVGEIIFGKQVILGTIVDGTRSGFKDFTSRIVDDFGNIELIRRPTARKAEWMFAFDTRSNRRIQRALEKARGVKCFFYPGEDMADFYLSVFGVADEFYPSLSASGTTVDTLSLTGVS